MIFAGLDGFCLPKSEFIEGDVIIFFFLKGINLIAT